MQSQIIQQHLLSLRIVLFAVILIIFVLNFRAVYIWVPLIFSLVVVGLLLVGKLLEKVPDGFLSWGSFWLWVVIVLLGSFGLSVVVYLLVSLKNKKVGDRSFNSRALCDKLLRDEIRERENFSLDSFIDTGESINGIM